MKIICQQEQLIQAIQTVQRAVSAKSNLQSIEGILFVAKDDSLTLTGYDFEMGIKTTIPCDVKEEGEVVLTANLLFNIVRKASQEIIIECEENFNCIISSGITEYKIKGIDPLDYPDFPSSSEDINVSLNKELFSEMLDYVIYAVSLDDKRPAHTGVLMKNDEENFTMVALDGYRLAICERKVSQKENFSMIVPAKAMQEVRRIIGESSGEFTIFANRRYIIFNIDNYIVLSRLLEGEFLDYKKAVPASCDTTMKIDVKEMSEAVERVSLIITERLKNPLKLNLENNKLTVKCSTEIGSVVDEITANQDGNDIEIGFNNRYILDALRACRKEEVVFEFTSPLAPCKIVPTSGDDFTYLVLPVRFKNE